MNWIHAARSVLRRVMPPEDAEVILGDLIEDLGGRAASTRIFFDALSIAARRVPRRRTPQSTIPLSKGRSMESLLMDARFAARSLAKRPSFTLVVLTTLALGIGAATAIFSVFEGILLRPLPFPVEEARIVYANETDGGNRMSFSWPTYVDVRERARSFEAMACHQGNAFNVVGDDHPRRVNGRLVCAEFFDVLGVKMQMGRTFLPEEDRPGASPVAIITDTAWHRDFGADPQILGRTLRTAEMTFTIVGVLPPEFRFSRIEDIFAPLGLTRTPGSGWDDRGNHFGLNAIARLKPDVTIEQADAELKLIADDLRRAYPNTNARNGAEVVPLRQRIVGDLRGTLVALMGAVGFLLLLACVNVANLLVARGASRQHELAVRTALGGSRWRLVRQLLVESTLLSLLGSILGIALAWVLLRTLLAFAPEGVPRIEEVGLNRLSLLFALASAAACGVIFGAFPAVQASGMRGGHALARASRTSAAVAPRRTRRVLMVVEVALALMLLIGCGLMGRTMLRLNGVDPGFNPDNLLTARVVLSGAAWNEPPRRIAFFEQLIDNAKQIPGVTHAAVTLSLPIEGSNWGSVFVVRDKPVPARADIPSAAFVPVSAGYFETMGIRLRRGREFTAHDSRDATKVVVVNQAFANRLWPGEDPVGKYVKQGWPETPEDLSPWRQVVGVVDDVKLEGVDRDAPLQAFLPLPQAPTRNAALVLRTSVDPLSLSKTVEATVHALNRELPVTRVLPMSRLMRDALGQRRLSAILLALFASVALVIAAVGLYGVVSHGVTERTREIGVRMALGAERGTVLRLFVWHGLITATVGVVLGLAGAYGLSRGLESLLFDVKPTDPATFAVVALLLLGVAALACYIPARRAAAIDPLAALRAE